MPHPTNINTTPGGGGCVYCQPTSLMCVPVCVLLPPRLQAYLRSSGSVGVDLFEECVVQRAIPFCRRITIGGMVDDSNYKMQGFSCVEILTIDSLAPTTTCEDDANVDKTVTKSTTSMAEGGDVVVVKRSSLLGAIKVGLLCWVGTLLQSRPLTSWPVPIIQCISAFYICNRIENMMYNRSVAKYTKSVATKQLDNLEMLKSFMGDRSFVHAPLATLSVTRFDDSDKDAIFESRDVIGGHTIVISQGAITAMKGVKDAVVQWGDIPPTCTRVVYEGIEEAPNNYNNHNTTTTTNNYDALTFPPNFIKGCPMRRGSITIHFPPDMPASLTSVGSRFMSHLGAVAADNVSSIVGRGDNAVMTPVRRVDLSILQFVTTIGDFFLADSHGLTDVDLSPLSNVTSIGVGFMARCRGLQSVSLHVDYVSSIGLGYLSGCTSLTHMDLTTSCTVTTTTTSSSSSSASTTFHRGAATSPSTSTTTRLTEVTEQFMENCLIVNFVGLHALSTAMKVGSGFLRGNLLPTIDLSSLSLVTTIGDNFLSTSRKLSSVDLSPLRNVTTIGTGFMGESALTTVDFTPLVNVVVIGRRMLFQCSKLRSVNLAGLSNVVEIPDRFMDGCTSLKHIDLSPLISVRVFRDDTLARCRSLESITLPHHHQHAPVSIGGSFCSRSGLRTVDLSSMAPISSIGERFLEGCDWLRTITLGTEMSFRTIPKLFLADCSSLQKVDFSSMNQITCIREDFMRGCERLESIDLTPFGNVISISSDFLVECKSLRVVDTSHLTGLSSQRRQVLRSELMMNMLGRAVI